MARLPRPNCRQVTSKYPALWFQGNNAGRSVTPAGSDTMSVLQVELPSELQSELRKLGSVDESHLAAWVTEAVLEKLAASKQQAYLEERAARGDRDGFRRVLGKVPQLEPAEEDRWYSGRIRGRCLRLISCIYTLFPSALSLQYRSSCRKASR